MMDALHLKRIFYPSIKIFPKPADGFKLRYLYVITRPQIVLTWTSINFPMSKWDPVGAYPPFEYLNELAPHVRGLFSRHG